MVIHLLSTHPTESSTCSHYETHECDVRDREVGVPGGVASTSRESVQGRRRTPLYQRLSSPPRRLVEAILGAATTSPTAAEGRVR
jgi:hypothetical protein